MQTSMDPDKSSDTLSPTISPSVYIVGAGPGDPDLLTVKALKLIQKADVLIYANSLIPKQIISAMRPDAEKIATANMTLEEIVPLMIARVRAGRSVVRLHSGDPSLYSAIHEQMVCLNEAAVPVEVVPGISAFQAAAARLQVELTIPGQVQSIILTRIGGRTQVPPTEELAGLAAHQASLCLYLSARHVEASQVQLLAHYPPQTPVAICFRVGWPDEQIQVVPLEQMAQVSAAEKLVRTTLYIISPALATASGSVRSRLYSPTHTHLFRPEVGRGESANASADPSATAENSVESLPLRATPGNAQDTAKTAASTVGQTSSQIKQEREQARQ